jgi:hypothetical protein
VYFYLLRTDQGEVRMRPNQAGLIQACSDPAQVGSEFLGLLGPARGEQVLDEVVLQIA